MRALLINCRMREDFWSFSTVLGLLGKKALVPPLGLLTVAALLPSNWKIEVVDLNTRELSEEMWTRCDIIFVTGIFVQYSEIIEMIGEGKRRGKTVVVGGPCAFHFPNDARQAGADFVVKGEGEVGVPRVVQGLALGESGGLIEALPLCALRDSPAPRYDLIDLNCYLDMATQFSRGCQFQCEFCDVPRMLGRTVRTKMPAQILKELENLYRMGWKGSVFFVDDNFSGSRVRAKALLKEMIPWLKDRGFPFQFYTQAAVSVASDSELLDLMVEAGFFRVFLGIETPLTESLKLTKKLQNVAVDLDVICEKIHRAGLQIMAGCIIGFDGEPAGADQRLIDFAVRNHIADMSINLLEATPGTDLWKRLESEGRLRWTGYETKFGGQTSSINFVPTRPIEEIEEEFVRTYEVLYDPGSYLDRAVNQFMLIKEYSTSRDLNSRPSWAELRGLLRTFTRQGLLYPSRWAFWKSLATAVARFPKKIPSFLAACVTAEHYYNVRQNLHKRFQGK